MARLYTRVHRLLRLIRLIQSKRGQNAADLARVLEIHERSVYRDIDTLNASGVPCHFDPETNGYCICNGFFMPPVDLTFEEAMALLAVLEGVASDGQVPFLGVATRAAEKIRSQLPPAILDAIEPFDDRVKIDLPAMMADESCRDVYDEVRTAIANERALLCTYDAPGTQHPSPEEKAAEFEFHPYALWFCQRAWYAVGHHASRGELRRLKLNRFTFLTPTATSYTIPDNFDPRQDLGLAWRMIRGDRHRIVIRFEKPFSDNASETRWHPTQEENWEEDGRLTLTFTVDGLDEIVWYVLGYGPNATVLEPAELATRVRDLARATAAIYSG